MVGGLVTKVFEIKPDFNSLKILPFICKKIIEGGDTPIIFAINKMLEMGFNILDIKNYFQIVFLERSIY